MTPEAREKLRQIQKRPKSEAWKQKMAERWQRQTEEYMALALPACQAIRAAAPAATVIGPAIAIAPVEANIDSQVFARLVLRNRPLMQCLDAFSFHPYRNTGPERLHCSLRGAVADLGDWQ